MSDTPTDTDSAWEASAQPAVNPEYTPPVEPAVATDAATDTPDAAPGEGDTPAPAEASADPAEPKVKRKRKQNPRGWLAAAVKRVCDRYVTGDLKPVDGEGNPKPLTPHRVANLVKDAEGLTDAPSTGAVAAVFQRWDEYGFATFSDKPLAFADYTDKGRTVGLSGILDERLKARKSATEAKQAEAKAAKAAEREKAKAEKAAAAEAAKAAKEAEAPAEVPEAVTDDAAALV